MQYLSKSARLFLLAVVTLASLATMGAAAQPQTPKEVLEQFFRSEELQADWFADAFLEQVSLTQIEAIRSQFSAQLGDFQRVEGKTSPFTVVFAQGSVMADVALDDAGKIAGLRFSQAQPTSAAQPVSPLQTPRAAGAQAVHEDVTPKAALERLFAGKAMQEAWFGDAFLSQVSVSQLETVLAGVIAQVGAYVRVEGDASPFTVVFENGTMPAEIHLDGDGRIIGLFFRPATPTVHSLEEALANFEGLTGDVSVLVLQDGEEVISLNADQPLAVGSAFKLAVLAALQEQIDAGEHTWDEVVMLKPEWKSLPSGILQDRPDDSPLTLHTLATLMISISDNTAADTLLHVVGRENVEALTARNQPFLTTQEMVKLKAPENAKLLARFQAGSEAQERQVLTELEALPLPNVADYPSAPTALDVEWRFTPHELCALMEQVQALDMMSVNPGVANAKEWARVAYKGGSEPGVLNLTTWLQAKNGDTFCVVATQNREDAVVDEMAVFGDYSALIGALPPDGKNSVLKK